MYIKNIIIIGNGLVIINIKNGTVEGVILAEGTTVYIGTNISKLLPSGSETKLVINKIFLETKDIYDKLTNLEKEINKLLNHKNKYKNIKRKEQLIEIKTILIETKKIFIELAFIQNILKKFYASTSVKNQKALVSKQFTKIAIDTIKRKIVNDRLNLIKTGMVLKLFGRGFDQKNLLALVIGEFAVNRALKDRTRVKKYLASSIL